MLIDEIDLRSSAILLDVDGTLLDIAPTPAAVQASPKLKETLARLAEATGGALAFVSGRPLADLDRIFDPLRVPSVGGHGAEIRMPAGGVASEARTAPLDPALRKALAAVAAHRPGVILEDKGYAVALHYRLASPEDAEAVKAAARAICAGYPAAMIELMPGKSVIEVKRPAFNKGTGVREIMMHVPFRGRRPVFIGDDVTDEAAFAVLPEFNGLGFSVGRVVPGLAGCFATPEDVRAWLCRVADAGRRAPR